MSAYSLTLTEALALSISLHLPVQSGSALAGWLGSARMGKRPASLEQSLVDLQHKKVFDPSRVDQPFHEGFLASLMLLCMNPVEVTVLIQRNGLKNLTRFAQAGESLVQFGMDETSLAFQDKETLNGVAGSILPDWFTANPAASLRAELPLGAFLLFKQAGIQADLALVDSRFTSSAFKKSMLLQHFKADQRWLNIFAAEGLRGILPVSAMPLDDYFNQLCGRGYLVGAGRDLVQIGEDGRPLAACLADPDLCTLSITLAEEEGDYPQAGAFLNGGGSLFLVEMKPGLLILQELPDLTQGQAWIKKMLVKGSLARFKQVTISPMTNPPAAAPAARVKSAPSPSLAELAEEATVLKSRSWFLIAESGPLQGQRFELSSRLTIGRGLDCNLALADKQVSRRHAVIDPLGGRYQVSDLGSGNGTHLNGVHVSQPTVLKPGDVLQIGDTSLRVSGPAGAYPQAVEERTEPKPIQATSRVKAPESTMPTQGTRPRTLGPSAARSCPHCGAAIKTTTRFCPACGKELP